MTQPPALPSILAAAQAGDRIKTLQALRDRLSADIDNPLTSARDVAALSRQLTDVLAEIEKEAPAKQGSPLDEFTARRRRRQQRPAEDRPRTGAPGI